jgi:hypothetical protein
MNLILSLIGSLLFVWNQKLQNVIYEYDSNVILNSSIVKWSQRSGSNKTLYLITPCKKEVKQIKINEYDVFV